MSLNRNFAEWKLFDDITRELSQNRLSVPDPNQAPLDDHLKVYECEPNL